MDQASIYFNFKNITANNNKAGEAGAFIFFEKQVGTFDLDFYDGENNLSTFGEVTFSMKDLPGITITSMTNKSVGAASVVDFTVINGSGSLVIVDANNVKISNFKIDSCSIMSNSIIMEEIKSNFGKIDLTAINQIDLINMEMINSPDIKVSAPKTHITDCTFKYEKKENLQTQIRTLHDNSLLTISNSTFITNENNFGTTRLIIQDDCCFNKARLKSIKLPVGSTIEASENVFECKIFDNDVIETLKPIQEPKEFDLIGCIIIVGSIVALTLVLAFYYVSSTKKPDELSDNFEFDEPGQQIQVNMDGTTVNTSNHLGNSTIYTIEFKDISDILTLAFRE